MKPAEIFDVMDLAYRANQQGNILVPLFIGPPGVGKSHIIQQWAKKNNLMYIDLRIAYLESPDFIGFPVTQIVDGRQVTTYYTPDRFPTDGEGVVVFEEPNRGTTTVLNCMMQALTDKCIDKYKFPKGWFIAGAINEGADYDTNTMDPALKNRFIEFHVTYDKQSFLTYMHNKQFDERVINFVESGIWSFKDPEKIGNTPGAKYISPRTLEQLNSALKANVPPNLELVVFEGILGQNVAKDFYNFIHDESPVTSKEIKSSLKKSLKRLSTFSNPENYKNGMISLTVRDIILNDNLDDETLAAVVEVIPVEQSLVLISELEFKRKVKEGSLLRQLASINKNIHGILKGVARYEK
jgi:hypothetical protein